MDPAWYEGGCLGFTDLNGDTFPDVVFVAPRG